MSISFDELVGRLHRQSSTKRIAVVCPADPHTEYVLLRSLRENIARFILVIDTPRHALAQSICNSYPTQVEIEETETPYEAARLGVALVHAGRADVLMKGTLNTDVLLKAVLDKETGLLPRGQVLSHITVAQIPDYKKLLFFSDAAVVPRPTLAHFEAMLKYDMAICKQLGIDIPRVALIHCTEKINGKFPHTLGYVILKERTRKGRYGLLQIDGPMDVKTACDIHSSEIKGIESDVAGNADILIFPNIESSNTFYKTLSLFGNAYMAGMLTGTTAPVILPSRADSNDSKFYSLVLACLTSCRQSDIHNNSHQQE